MLPFLSNAQPVAAFVSNISAGCSPIVVQFTDQTTDTPTSWHWDLGNGATSTLQNPSTTYINSGVFTVKLVAYNSRGADSTTGTITVYPSPVVAFTGDTNIACPPVSKQFINLSTPGGTGAPSYLWDFGDGHTSFQANPVHIYTTTGNFNITLIATNSYGCTKTHTRPNFVPIVPRPISAFTSNHTNACNAPDTVVFIDTSKYVTSYSWDFGDGGTSTLANPTHVYVNKGTYTVKLITGNISGCKDTLVKPGYITVGILKSNFTFTPNPVCAKRTVTFTNTTTPNVGTSTWNFGDGGSSTLTNPTYPYLFSGGYMIQLISSYNGCNDTAYKAISVNTSPTINFSGNNLLSCAAPMTTQFTNTSFNATSYLWMFGDGSTSTFSNPSHTYTVPGKFTVKLKATFSNGCTDTLVKNEYIKIEPPVATISNSPPGCPPTTTNFTANSNSPSPVVGYTWDFGDGSPPLSCACQSTSHTYYVADTFTVSVVCTTASGCIFGITKMNVYDPKPVAGFTMSATTVCPKQPIIFMNTTTGAVSYYWADTGGNSSINTNPIFKYKTPGVYTVRLIAANNNGCKDTFELNDTINLPKADFRYSFPCSNRLSVSFTDSSKGADTYYWNFGDGNTTTTSGSVSHTYATYGTYTVKLAVKNFSTGCPDTNVAILNLTPLANQLTANDTTICPGDSVGFTANSAASFNYAWNFGDGVTVDSGKKNIYHTYTAPGYYTVKVVISDTVGCKDSIIKTDFVRAGGATVDFSATPPSGCIPLNPTFVDQSIPSGGFAVASRKWSFGDGDTSIAASPSHTYAVSGKYNVTLTVKDANNCTSFLTKPDFVYVSKPNVDFTTPDTLACKGHTVHFTNTTTNAVSYLWVFGATATSIDTNPSRTYSLPGDYYVKLIATDSFGCKDSLFKPAYIHIRTPDLSFTMSDSVATCPPLVISFTNGSKNAGNYTWSFGNNNQSNLVNPATSYTYPGNYTIMLIGENNFGCRDTITKTAIVYGPTATFSYGPKVGCTPLNVSFATVATNTAYFIWDMDNGVTQNTSTNTLTYSYTESGKYTPKLILSDGVACFVPIQGTDTIYADHLDVDFTFSPNRLCDSGTAQFIDTINNSLTALTSTFWNFGDNTTSIVHNPAHFYATPGNYTVSLFLSNGTGCLDTIVKTVPVHAHPTVSGGPDKLFCFGQALPVSFHATGAVSYLWSPTTGLTCTNCDTPAVIPTATTTYTVTGIDANGCVDTATVTVNAHMTPVTSVSNDTVLCIGDTIVLKANGAAVYNWWPSAGLSCNNCDSLFASPNATTTYSVSGISIDGCKDTVDITVSILALPVVTVDTDRYICLGTSTTLKAGGAKTYTWSPSLGLSCDTCGTTIATPTGTTTYLVTGADSFGCRSSNSIHVGVYRLPVIEAGEDRTICEGELTQLLATGALDYSWSPDSFLSCKNCSSPVAKPNDTITYIVSGIDTNGCEGTDSVNVFVINKVDVKVNSKDSVCRGEEVKLFASGGTDYLWIPSTGLSNDKIAEPFASPDTSMNYMVIVKQGHCFTDTAYVELLVNDKTIFSAGPDQNIFAGNSITLNNGGTDLLKYKWEPETDLSCTECTSPVASPKQTRTYTVTGTNHSGCSSKDDVTVFVTCDKTLLFVANTFTPNGDGINDVFYVQGKGIPTVQRMTIFNRWGQIVFDARNVPMNDPAYGWKGTMKGEPVSPDVFIYILQATCESGSPVELKGDISLIR